MPVPTAAGQIKKELDMLLIDLARLSDRSENVSKHFAATQKDIDELQTSINKIKPRAEKIKELDFE